MASETNTLAPADQYARLVRKFLQDFAAKNHLLEDEEEFSNDLIIQSVLMALEVYNSCTGHLTNDPLEKFPVPTLLVLGGAGFTLISGGISQARNHFSVSDGNTSGPISEKTDLYRGWGQELVTLFTTMSAKYKEARNMESVNRSFSSNYLLTYFYKDGLFII
jgi:hypothetical protein